MKRHIFTICLCVAVVLCLMGGPAVAKNVKTLAIGSPAPELNLPGVDGKTYRLADFKKAKVLVVIFTCNHCPTAQAYEPRIMKMHADYLKKGVALVAISSNDPLSLRLDEQGYTDVGDSFDDMKLLAKRRGFKFPYLYDGDEQRVATAYGALATPHVFIFDAERKLRYNGRIDDADIKPPKSHDARNAIDAILAGRPVEVPKTRVYGCSTKWSDKRPTVKESIDKWNKEPVALDTIDAKGLRKLAANQTNNYVLLNLWSTSCAPCITEMPELVTINRMYRRRHFRVYSLSIDPPQTRQAALEILRKNYMSCTNYIFDSEDRDKLAEALDPTWEGPVPYTILIAPGGKIVRRWKDEIDPQKLKTEISELLGKTYASRVTDAGRRKVHIKSTADGSMQPAYVILPDGFEPGGKPRPLLVSLHTWSNGAEQRLKEMEEEAARRGWIYLFPHFRGPNRNPKACASPEARQDILDTVDWALEKYPIDTKRIYLCGGSGGGHMSLVMAGRYPKRWTAVSAWVPISDLAAWWRFHGDKSYGLNVVASCGGRPGDSTEVDRQYFERSPINFLDRAVGLNLEIAAGIHDGHKGSVPVRHTLEAYNVVAKAQGKPVISEEEILQLSRPKGRLEKPQPSDQVEDPTYKRAIYLRRQAGNARVTIFEGGHERLTHAAAEWLKGHVKETEKE